jgi:glycine oxidase
VVDSSGRSWSLHSERPPRWFRTRARHDADHNVTVRLGSKIRAVASSHDIVVIGSGIIGCAVAFELGRRGAQVLVVDDREPGMGATQASAGMLAPYNEVESEGPHLELTARSLDAYDDFMARVRADSAQVVEYRRTGTLTVAFDAGETRRLNALATFLGGRGVVAKVLDADDLRREEPALSSAALCGLLVPCHGFVAAAALARALALAAERHGVRFERAPRASRVRARGSRLEISNGSWSVSAARVVIAAGSWASQIDVEGATGGIPVHPVRGQLLQLRACGPNLRRVTWGDRCYLVPWSDGSLLVGATVEQVGFDERTTIGGLQELLDGLGATLDPTWAASPLGARAGLRPGTPDDLPIIGAFPTLPAVMYATGHYRNGVLLAPITATLVADAMLDGRVDRLLEATRPGRFGGSR